MSKPDGEVNDQVEVLKEAVHQDDTLSQTSSVKSLVRSFKSRVTASQASTSASQIQSLQKELEQEKLARLTLEKQL